MTVTRPCKNAITQYYHNGHKGYDFSGKGDADVVACLSGVVIQSVDKYVNSWRNYGTLTTRDYGNYIKLRHDDGSFSLYAHLARHSPLAVGSKTQEGQKIGIIGNTGNSTGPHLHFEFRNANNNNQPVYFREKDSMPSEGKIELDKKKFEELVTKATAYDNLLKTFGTASAVEIKKMIDDRDDSIKEKNKQLRLERERADNARKEFNDLVAACAKALNTPQEPNQIITALSKLKDDLDTFDDLQMAFANLQLSTNKEKEDLNTEIDRLKALVKYGDVGDFSMEELIGEIIKRLLSIVRKS